MLKATRVVLQPYMPAGFGFAAEEAHLPWAALAACRFRGDDRAQDLLAMVCQYRTFKQHHMLLLGDTLASYLTAAEGELRRWLEVFAPSETVHHRSMAERLRQQVLSFYAKLDLNAAVGRLRMTLVACLQAAKQQWEMQQRQQQQWQQQMLLLQMLQQQQQQQQQLAYTGQPAAPPFLRMAAMAAPPNPWHLASTGGMAQPFQGILPDAGMGAAVAPPAARHRGTGYGTTSMNSGGGGGGCGNGNGNGSV